MLQGKTRTAVWTGLVLYTGLTLFFLFVGFNRSSALPETGLRYHLSFDGIPLIFPGYGYSELWVFSLGNYLAFVPFGLFIPLLVRSRFLPFLLVFIAAITGVELIQMVTHLGAFDINDIVVNTLGAAVGYGAQRLIRRDRWAPIGMLKLLSSGAVLTLLVYSAVSGINYYLEHGRGRSGRWISSLLNVVKYSGNKGSTASLWPKNRSNQLSICTALIIRDSTSSHCAWMDSIRS